MFSTRTILPLTSVRVAISFTVLTVYVGLTASLDSSNHLTLSYINSVSSIRLRVFGATLNAGSTTFYNDFTTLGFANAYVQTQSIQHPYSEQSEDFGSKIKFVESQRTLLVGSEGAPTVDHTVIDNKTTVFDGGALVFFDRISNTGAVYIFEELGNSTNSINTPSHYGFIQEIINNNIQPGDNFGSSIATNRNLIFVGANNASTTLAQNVGRVYYFTNINYSKGWELLRQQQPQVDTNSLTRIFLYDNVSQTILSNLDHVDPVKGKILGVADQDIEYRTEFDPASYNTSSNPSTAFSNNYNWGLQQVGRLWWNLSLVRYVDYEQGSLTYRINNWGKLFPESIIEINEWVESFVLPSKYVGDGTVKYVDDSAYVVSAMVDPATGNVITTYYFWVTNKTTFDEKLPFRRTSALSISTLISDPASQDIPYAALIQNNSVALFSADQFISSDNTILHIDYALLQSNNIIHNEYELVQENSDTAILPNRIVNKFIDSITGADIFGNIVPDPTLKVSERYGITIRPRQTMFVDKLTATENFVQFVNNIFLSIPIAEEFNLAQLYLSEPEPTSWDPVANQNISVDTYIELSYIDTNTLVLGQRILVHTDSNYNNQWAIYEYNITFSTVRIQTYQTSDYWIKIDWVDTSYDPTVNPTYTVNTVNDMATLTLVSGNIVRVLNNGAGQFEVYRINDDLTKTLVSIQNGTIQLSDALWQHTTHGIGFDNDSFDTVKYDLNPTTEFRNIVNALKDDIFINTLEGEFNNVFFMMLNYILSEQRVIDWAFKTSFISIIHKLRKLDQYPVYVRDNQTYYEDYIKEVKPYRTTIREYVLDYEGNDTASIHPTDFDLPAYYDTTLGMWRSPSGEQVGDATLLSTQSEYADWYANHTFSINSVKIENEGIGYSAPPALMVQGGGGTGALFQTTIGNNGNVTSITVINPGYGYTSTPTVVAMGDGIDEAGNQTLICYPMLTNSTIRTITTTLKFDRFTYSSYIKQWAKNTAFDISDIIAYNNAVYSVKATFTTGTVFVPSDYTILTTEKVKKLSAADRVTAFYNPSTGMIGKDLARLFSGTEYPGNLVDGSEFVENESLPADTNIQSEFQDLELGTRPEDINVVGGAFVDTYSSHAPEELVPGMIYDTLDIKVFTVDLAAPENAPVGYRITQKMSNDFVETTFSLNLVTFFDSNTTNFRENLTLNTGLWEFRRICAAHTTTLARPLHITDTLIYVSDIIKMPVPNVTLAIPGIVYINSEKITYYTMDLMNGTLGQIRRGVWGTGAPTLHDIGSIVCDASIAQEIPGGVTLDTATATTSWLDLSPLPTQIVVGNGIRFSSTQQALFLQACPSYLPWLPGGSGLSEDPNAHNTRFDDDGTGELNTPVHPFDIDPFDSYIVG